MFEEITTRAEEVLVKAFGKRSYVLDWKRPHVLSQGDLATSIALSVARELKMKPQEVAETLAEGLKGVEGVASAEVAGPGYVNVRLTPSAFLVALPDVAGSCMPRKPRKDAAPVLIDYSAPNIAKPLGIHHILSTVIGQVLANLHRHLGFSVVGINYIGDWGTQFGKLAVGLRKGGKKPVAQSSVDDLLTLYVRFHDEAEKDPSMEDEARAVFQKLEQGDAELEKFLQDVVAVTMADVEKLYERLHVKLDVARGEYHYRNAMEPIIAEGIKKKLFVEGEEGALIVRFPEESGLPTGIVRKGDGASVYLTRDLAAVRDRIDTWHPSAILYVVDVSQSLHLQQLFEACRLLQWDLPVLEHVVFGHMRFADKSMSTRKGNILKLQDVLDEAVRRADTVITEHEKDIQTDDRKGLAEMMGIGAVVYGILSQNRKADIVFDWKKVLAFDGNSAPYLQYTHARALSVLRKAEQAEYALPSTAGALSDRERTLMGALLDFPHTLEEARTHRMPHTLSNYLYGLCQEFNAFYNTEPILKAENPARALRLALTSLTATVLKTGATLLTLRVPERM